MRKLTENQDDLLKCLTEDFTMFGDICDKFADLMVSKNSSLSPSGYVWKSKVSRVINTLIKRGLVEYEYRGLYKLKDK